MFHELKAFLRARRFYSAVALMLAVSLANFLFGTFPIPVLSRSQQGYGHAVIVLISPVVASLIALGATVSRLSQWERMAARSLVAPRAALAVAVILLAIATVIPGSIRAGVPNSALLATQGVFALVGMGLILNRLAGYEIQVILITSYGLMSVLLVRAVPDLVASFLLVGQVSSLRLITSGLICFMGICIFATDPSRRTMT